MMPTQTTPVSAYLVQVGEEMIPVYGDENRGWSLEREDLQESSPFLYRYQSLEELFFALVNLSVSPLGSC